jgi:hypothetical protein
VSSFRSCASTTWPTAPSRGAGAPLAGSA